jgi:NAD(P)-dependent dehydrogenase (short-subunit alcohol dehydrogenase family)
MLLALFGLTTCIILRSSTPMRPHAQQSLLAGKVLVIIGGTTGIGLSASKAFAEAGAKLVVVGLDAESVVAVEKELGGVMRAFCADAAQPGTVDRAIKEAIQTWGSFHGLYHVAGGSGRKWGDGPLHEISDEGWRKTLDLNLTSVMYSNRAAVRQFLAQKTGGSILNVGSVLANSPSPRFFATHAYAAAKAAIEGFTKSCAAYYAPGNIRFNVLAAGLIATPMAARAQTDINISNYIRRKQPLDGRRIGAPEDLDAAAVYLMSDGSRFVTGQVLTIDGGWTVTEVGPDA